MAKVTGPLFSLSASGKIGDAMVHFGWKGLNVVRGWVRPKNPEMPEQGDYRLKLGGLGMATRCAAATSLYRDDAILSQAAGQTWVSSFVGYMAQNVLKSVANLEAVYALYTAHSATKAVWDAQAALLELALFDMPYKTTTAKFDNGFQLYCLAHYGIAMRAAKEGVFDRTPYTVALVDWAEANIIALRTDLTAV